MNRLNLLAKSLVLLALVLLCSSQAWAITDYTGWWWEGADYSGTGISIEDQENSIYLAWYGYDDSGQPVWYSALAQTTDGQVYTGLLGWYTGWPLEDDSPQDGYAGTAVGQVTITFNSATDATFNYTVDGGSYSKHLTRYWPGDTDPRLLHGWWYDPDRGGMGIFMEARDGQLFGSWYHYRDDQSPRWWITLGNFPSQSTSYFEPLGEFNSGQTLTGAYQAAEFDDYKGTFDLSFTNESHATLLWQGITYNLERFTFAEETQPNIAETDDPSFPTMLVRKGQSMVTNPTATEASVYTEEGEGVWTQVENGAVGPRTTGYAGDYVAVAERTGESRSNLAVVDSGGDVTSYTNLRVNENFWNRNARSRDDNVGGLIDLASNVGALACLVASVIDEAAPAPLQLFASLCESTLLRETAQAEGEEDFGTAATLVNVGACGDDGGGTGCTQSLAVTTEQTGTAFIVFADQNQVAMNQAQDAVDDGNPYGNCLEDISVPTSLGGTISPDCESLGYTDYYSNYYSFYLAETSTVTIYMEGMNGLDTWLGFIASGDPAGVVSSWNDDIDGDNENYNSRLVFECLSPGTYTIEASTAYAEDTGNYTLQVTTNTCGGTTDLVGVWDLNYYWDDLAEWYTSDWTLYEDHTFVDGHNASGTWTQDGNDVVLTYSSGTTYTGVLSGDTMSGTMVSASDRTGSWNASKQVARRDAPVKKGDKANPTVLRQESIPSPGTPSPSGE